MGKLSKSSKKSSKTKIVFITLGVIFGFSSVAAIVYFMLLRK